jgi:probable HAF family extracellular repeat protein
MRGSFDPAALAAHGDIRGDELMRSLHCAFAAALLSVSAASAAFAAASLTPLGDLPGGPFQSYAYGVSADGSVVVGNSTYSVHGHAQAFRWTSDGGMVGLGDLPGDAIVSYADGVSADGRTIVGTGTRNGRYEAFRWTSEGGMVGLGHWPLDPSLDPQSGAVGASADGSTVVGITWPGCCGDIIYYEAFRWTSGGGMGGLGGFLPSQFFGRGATGVSGDGSVVVG